MSRLVVRVLAAVLAAVVVTGLPMAARAATDPDYTKYYVVQSAYQGKAETIYEISARFLGTDARYTEIMNLNTGRKQPDGGVLQDPSQLKAGWLLMLPWDAFGDEVDYGALPAKAPAPTKPSPVSPPQASAKPGPARPGPKKATTTKKPKPAASKPPAGEKCTAMAASAQPDWAALRVAANQAWPQSKGDGSVVAVVDSGVAASLPQLSGRVSMGINMVDAKGRADVDCQGSGTSMAALVAARATKGSDLSGVAPDATVLPIRILTTAKTASSKIQIAALDQATAAGATIVALGSAVNPEQAGVTEAIAKAVKSGALVVMAAPTGATPADSTVAPQAGVLRVAGVGVDGQTAADYKKGMVDVAAPGVNVTSLGVTGTGGTAGTGSNYAVAYVAGEAALVRAVFPELTADQVAHRIMATADPLSDTTVPDARYGWGMINPGTAVTKTLPEEDGASGGSQLTSGTAGRSETAGHNTFVLVVIVVMALALATLLALRFRWVWRTPDEEFEDRAVVNAPRPLAPAGVRGDDDHWSDDRWSSDGPTGVPAEYADRTSDLNLRH